MFTQKGAIACVKRREASRKSMENCVMNAQRVLMDILMSNYHDHFAYKLISHEARQLLATSSSQMNRHLSTSIWSGQLDWIELFKNGSCKEILRYQMLLNGLPVSRRFYREIEIAPRSEDN